MHSIRNPFYQLNPYVEVIACGGASNDKKIVVPQFDEAHQSRENSRESMVMHAIDDVKKQQEILLRKLFIARDKKLEPFRKELCEQIANTCDFSDPDTVRRANNLIDAILDKQEVNSTPSSHRPSCPQPCNPEPYDLDKQEVNSTPSSHRPSCPQPCNPEPYDLDEKKIDIADVD